MISLTHDNILRFIEAKKTSNNIYIFFEFWNGGDLSKFIKLHNNQADEELLKTILKQIAECLGHLNKNKIAYRDIRVDDILINFPDYLKDGLVSEEYQNKFDIRKDTIEIKIGDLGLAKTFEDYSIYSSYESSYEMSQEIIYEDHPDTRGDISSFGAIMYELLMRYYPIKEFNHKNLNDNYFLNCYEFSIIGLPINCLDLLNKCLLPTNKNTITHTDILNHSFWVEDGDMISLYLNGNDTKPYFFNSSDMNEDLFSISINLLDDHISTSLQYGYLNCLKRIVSKQNKDRDLRRIKTKDEPNINFIILNDDKNCEEKDLEIKKKIIIENPIKNYSDGLINENYFAEENSIQKLLNKKNNILTFEPNEENKAAFKTEQNEDNNINDV